MDVAWLLEQRIGFIPQFYRAGWLHGYQPAFAGALEVRFEDIGADLALLEQLVLARNRAQHPEVRHTSRRLMSGRRTHPRAW